MMKTVPVPPDAQKLLERLCDTINDHGKDLEPIFVLATASQLIGGLVAQNDYSRPMQALVEIILHNVEIGNQTALDSMKDGAKKGDLAGMVVKGRA